MRPNSIIWFDRAYMGSLVASLASTALSLSESGGVPSDPTLGEGTVPVLMVSLAIGFGVSLFLWFLISRKASKAAKWIFLVLFAISLAMLPTSLAQSGDLTVLNTAPLTISYVLQLVAAIMLFRPDAREWFARRGRMAAADASAFH